MQDWSSQSVTKLIDHFTSGCNTSEVDTAMDYLQRHHGFRLRRHVCLNCRHGLPSTGYSPDDIMDLITKDVSIRNTTFLFNKWTYATNLEHQCQYHSCSKCENFHNNEYRKLIPSSQLKQDAKVYLEDVLMQHQFLLLS